MANISKITLPDGASYDIRDTSKQAILVSGTNIKTVNGNSLLGSGNITISGGTTYTAGTGIDITNGVISLNVTDVENAYGGRTITIGGGS